MDNEKKPCCCCGTPAQPEAATAAAVDASAVPTESVTPSCCFSKELLAQHISTCVADDLRAGSEAKLDELVNLLPKLMK